MLSKANFNQAMRFAAVGVFNTAATIGLTALLRATTTLPLGWASGLAYAATVLGSFVLNQAWTFRDAAKTRPLAQRLALFVLGNTLAGAAYVGAVLALATVMPELWATIAAVGASFVVNYAFSKLVVFA